MVEWLIKLMSMVFSIWFRLILIISTWEGVVVLKELIFKFLLLEGMVVLNELISTVYALQGCGGFERTDF